MQEGLANGKTVYLIWMKEESDLIQATAKAFGERMVLEQCVHTLAKCDQSISTILHQLILMYASVLLEEDLAWFLCQKLVSTENAKQLAEVIKQLVKDIAPQALNIADSLGVKGLPLYAPIASDWVKYNETDNRGELVRSRL